MKLEIFLLFTFVVLSHQLPMQQDKRQKRQIIVNDASIDDGSISDFYSDSNDSEYIGTDIIGTQLFAILKRRCASETAPDTSALTRTKRHSIDPVDNEISVEKLNPLYYGIRLRKQTDDNDIIDKDELLQVAETHVFRPIFRYKSEVAEKRRIRTPPKS